MPKITTQIARQRYKRVPVMEPDPDRPGEERQQRVTVNRARRKGDAPITKLVFTNDKNQPLPPRKCEKCGAKLTVGQKYQSIGIKMQHGGIVRYRCTNCPTWQPHEYSNALWARITQIQNEDVDGSSWTEESEAQDRANEIAEMIRELAGEKQESFDNMPEGLQQGDTGQELEQAAQDLESWADEFDSISFPDFPEGTCANCGGEELTHDEHSEDCPPDCDGTEECMECQGSGEGEASEEALEDWRQEAAQAIRDVLENAPAS